MDSSLCGLIAERKQRIDTAIHRRGLIGCSVRLRRGDTVITQGGIVAKITKVIDDDNIEIEIADGVRVRQLRSMITGVRAKGEPAKEKAAT